MTNVALPRSVAAGITVRGLATTQRVIVAIGSIFAAVIAADVLFANGAAEAIPLIVTPFLGMSVLALLLIWRPTVITAALFVGGGAILSLSVAVFGLAADPQFDDPGPFLLNRVATAMCLVGAINGRAVNGLVWTTGAYLVAQASVLLGILVSGADVRPGSGPLIVFSISFAAYATLALSQRQSERQLRPIIEAADDLRLADRVRSLEQRAAGVLHDTLLAGLETIARSPGTVSSRARAVLTEHLAVVARSSVADGPIDSVVRSEIGEALLELAHEYQWSGVRVDVSGADSLSDNVPPATTQALIGAAGAALDNVVKHAGTDRAELVVGVRGGSLTVLIVDDGPGFTTLQVADDRLGLHVSIEERLAQVGGALRVWSGPGGTTVMMTVPIDGGER